MKIHVKCERCKRESVPLWRSGIQVHTQGYQQGAAGYEPPSAWREVGGYLLCTDCAEIVDRAIREAITNARCAK